MREAAMTGAAAVDTTTGVAGTTIVAAMTGVAAAMTVAVAVGMMTVVAAVTTTGVAGIMTTGAAAAAAAVGMMTDVGMAVSAAVVGAVSLDGVHPRAMMTAVAAVRRRGAVAGTRGGGRHVTVVGVAHARPAWLKHACNNGLPCPCPLCGRAPRPRRR